MDIIRNYIKKRVTLHDFRQIIMFYRTHLKELLRRKSEFQIDTFDAIRFILEENLDLYESIITLYKKGHIQACLLVARPIVENNINLQYILQKDTEKRARNFILQSTHYLLNGLKYSEDSSQVRRR